MGILASQDNLIKLSYLSWYMVPRDLFFIIVSTESRFRSSNITVICKAIYY